MFNEKQIEKYIYKYTRRQDDFYMAVIKLTAERVAHNVGIESLDKMFSLSEAFKSSHDMLDIKKLQAAFKKSMVDMLRGDLLSIADKVYTELRPLFDGVSPTLRANLPVYTGLIETIEDAAVSLGALIDKPIFVINGKKYTPQDAYKYVVQAALQTKQLKGPIRSMRYAVEPLFNTRLQYESNLTDDDGNALTSDVRAVRMNVLSSIKKVFEVINNNVMKQVSANGIELSAHIHPAPDHEPVQGHQFSLAEFAKMQSGQDFVDVNGTHYSGFPRQIGAWNCRHYTKPIIVGVTKPEYTEKELQEIKDKNAKGYTTSDGKHYTLYECTQVQRGYERHIRENKEKYVIAKTLKDKTKMAYYKGKVNSYTNEYKAFSSACGINTSWERVRVTDY